MVEFFNRTLLAKVILQLIDLCGLFVVETGITFGLINMFATATAPKVEFAITVKGAKKIVGAVGHSFLLFLIYQGGKTAYDKKSTGRKDMLF